jgi:hypothetical protein
VACLPNDPLEIPVEMIPEISLPLEMKLKRSEVRDALKRECYYTLSELTLLKPSSDFVFAFLLEKSWKCFH